MGVPSEDCLKVAELVGVKTMLNEFVAFERLGIIMKDSEQYRTQGGTPSMLTYLSNGSVIFNDGDTTKLFQWGIMFVSLIYTKAILILNFSFLSMILFGLLLIRP